MKASKVDSIIKKLAPNNLAYKDEEKDLALQLGAKDYLIKAAQKPEAVVEVVKKYIV